jgi:Flp pilus assembly protein TadG
MQNSATTVWPAFMFASQAMLPKPNVSNRGKRYAWRNLPGCRRAAAAVEFALVSGPFLLMLFGFVATNSMFYCWSVMQNNAQYAAMMMATGQVTSWSSSGTSCGSSLTNTQVEYYATESCSVPNVSVTLTTNASSAGLADIYSLFSGITLTASATAMKQGSCP